MAPKSSKRAKHKPTELKILECRGLHALVGDLFIFCIPCAAVFEFIPNLLWAVKAFRFKLEGVGMLKIYIP